MSSDNDAFKDAFTAIQGIDAIYAERAARMAGERPDPEHAPPDIPAPGAKAAAFAGLYGVHVLSSAPPAPAPASTPPVPKSEPASREDLRSLGRLVGYAFNSAGYVVNMTPTDEPVHNVEEQRGAALLSYLRSVKPALLNSISEPGTAELRERLSATEGALGSLQDAMIAQSRMHAAVVKRLNDALESQTKRAMNAETMNAQLRQNEPEQVAALKDEVWRLEDDLARLRKRLESECLVDLRMVSTGALSGAMLGACQPFCASSEPAFRSWLIEKAGVKL